MLNLKSIIKMNTLAKRLTNHDSFPSIMNSIFNEMDFHNNGVNTNVPAVNVKEDDGSFTLEIAAPGLKKEDFKVNLNEDKLTISNESKVEKDEVKDNYRRKEFNYASFSRTFVLPKTVEPDKIEATYVDGVLHIVIPKKEVTEAKLIKVG